MSRVVRYQGAIVRDDQILLIRHTHHEDGRSYWLIPGGGIEPGETAEACVAREMWEETGLRVRVEGLLLDEAPVAGQQVYQRYHTYLCRAESGEASPGYEPEDDAAAAYTITDVGWFALGDPEGWPDDLRADPITAPLLGRIAQALRVAPLAVVGVRYRGSRPAPGDERALDRYRAAGVYAAAGDRFELVEPAMPEERRSADEPANLGQICGAIAEAVAAARRAGRRVLLAGGDCSHTVGVLGGLQLAHGPAARIGLVWLDAHGDFNTPRTTPSGMLGGMPVAVCAGLAHPVWREAACVAAPMPTDRILLVDVRNLDPEEAALIRATDARVVAAPGRPGDDMAAAVAELAARCDLLYLHVDSDILDERFVPNHGTREPDGPDMGQVLAACDLVFATGKVAAFAVVSVYGEGPGSEVSVESGCALIRGGLEAWRRHGAA